jgi:HD-GYP domain-containing protein (c-di-GMP phosphodiesterase class II)
VNTYISVPKSQIHFYLETPLYIKNDRGKFVLYKAQNTKIDINRFSKDAHPHLYVPEEIKEIAFKELQSQLKNKLKKRVNSGDLKSIKSALSEIVQEAIQEPLEDNLQTLPETLDIIYQEYSNTTNLLKDIAGLQFGGTTLAEHSANVMLLVLNFCIFKNLPDEDTKKFSLGALLHDIGLTRIPKQITEANRKLNDSEFTTYKTHTTLGNDIIKENKHISSLIAVGVLEHHERLNGTGYPRGISNISFEGRLIGIIDCFDNLTNNEKLHRKKKDPFSAMKIIQDEILKEGLFDKYIFKDLCLSLLGKSKYS